ncbi:hypothetical protein ACFWEJ_07990 [Promicromonospora sp. NPDC060204]|uniref:hypothetical protein n=1 Tax=Promicromonospora sp. NPDC060204 TaxID=3347071 RepID=UPI003650C211
MRLARLVSYGTLGVLLAAGAAQIDFWPLSAYKLFSAARTDTTTSTQLVATLQDGSRAVVGRGSDPVLGPTQRFLPRLAGAAPAARDTMLTLWLEQGGVDPADVRGVRTERVRQVVDPVTLTWTETARDLVWESDPAAGWAG